MAIRIKVKPTEPIRLKIGSNEPIKVRTEQYKVIEVSSEPYTGTYTSDCKFVQQTFPTKDKRMTDDFKVNAIRVAETINPQGGKTVFIGL